MNALANRRVLVTGGAGFLGRQVCDQLQAYHPGAVLVPRKAEYDLTEQTAIRRMLDDFRPEVIIHLAAVVGGIGANRENPGRFFYENAVMGILLMEEARRRQVRKFVTVGTICSYPKHTAVPFREEDLWNGYPEETNAPYGIAKKAILVQGQAYRQQYGFDVIHLIPVNLYGPGDNFDPSSSHVIPALIKKCVDARESGAGYIDVWGTGSASREFLYVEDVGRAITFCLQNVHAADVPDGLLNVGCGEDLTIRELAGIVQRTVGYEGDLTWDATRPDGTPRKLMDVGRITSLGWRPEVGLEEGIRRTYDWYLDHEGS